MKIVDAIKSCIDQNRNFFGLEFFPPKAEAGAADLYERMEHLGIRLSPLFCGMTWSDDGSSAELSIEVCSTAQSLFSMVMQCNIACGDCTEQQLRAWLNVLRGRGIKNVLCCKGTRRRRVHRIASTDVMDSAPGEGPGRRRPKCEIPTLPGTFSCGADFVRFVKNEFGDAFCISVAGYPEAEYPSAPDAESNYRRGLASLKEKVDAGAQLIVSQMVFDAQTFLDFCTDCRRLGISCPILPGIMPIHSYAQFQRFHRVGFRGTELLDASLAPIARDDVKVRKAGVEFTIALVKTLFRAGVRGVYFYTNNLEHIVSTVVEELGVSRVQRDLPWRPSTNPARRTKEEVRPIFWSGRAKSYLARTDKWEEFPNAWNQWTRFSPTLPVAGEMPYHTQAALMAQAAHCTHLQKVQSLADVCAAFISVLDGTGTLPWSEEVCAESAIVMDSWLKPLNARGFLTINSQPAVNGARSDHQQVGWGPLGGYVYQKPYLEFFTAPGTIPTLVEVFTERSSVSFMGADAKGGTILSSARLRGESDSGDSVTAVTWGVFPNRDVLQPTVVSSDAFQAWVPEAFLLWETPFEGTDVPPIIHEIRTTWVLVTVLDNEYVSTPTPLSEAVSELCKRFPLLTATSGTPLRAQSHQKIPSGASSEEVGQMTKRSSPSTPSTSYPLL